MIVWFLPDPVHTMHTLDPKDYHVVWIAVLAIERRAARLMLDREHDGRFPMERGDDYVFFAGEMADHNVVIATLPEGREYGTGSAAALASQVKKFFPNLWFGLLVGVAAGLPNLDRKPKLDIRLGDILVAVADGDSPGLVAYELGREGRDGLQLLRGGRVLDNTEAVVLSAIGSIKDRTMDDQRLYLKHYESMKDKEWEHRNERGAFGDPGQERDTLYALDTNNTESLVSRDNRPDNRRTRVWYGSIGSGEKLMKNRRKRDELRDAYNLIGLEMEAAGTINRIPVGVIRGVCDYGDEDKNKEWQPYAAAMAAAYAKAVLVEARPKPCEYSS
jgi:nucleoside phosphorylase